jgi:hypothetical protein
MIKAVTLMGKGREERRGKDRGREERGGRVRVRGQKKGNERDYSCYN